MGRKTRTDQGPAHRRTPIFRLIGLNNTHYFVEDDVPAQECPRPFVMHMGFEFRRTPADISRGVGSGFLRPCWTGCEVDCPAKARLLAELERLKNRG